MALVLIVIGVYGMALQRDKKLKPVIEVITSDNNINATTAGSWIMAFIVYLFILSFMGTNEGIGLTVILVLGGLMYNNTVNKGNNVFTNKGVKT